MLQRGRSEDRPRVQSLLNLELKSLEQSCANETGLIEVKPNPGTQTSESRRTPEARAKGGLIDKDKTDELEELGRTLIDAGMLIQATRVYMIMLREAPTSHKAFHGLSVSALQRGEYSEGIDAAKRSLEFRPSFVPAMHNLVLAYYRQGQYIRARYWLTQALRLEPDDAQLRRLRLRLRVRTVFGVLTWVSSRCERLTRPLRSLVARPVR